MFHAKLQSIPSNSINKFGKVIAPIPNILLKAWIFLNPLLSLLPYVSSVTILGLVIKLI